VLPPGRGDIPPSLGRRRFGGARAGWASGDAAAGRTLPGGRRAANFRCCCRIEGLVDLVPATAGAWRKDIAKPRRRSRGWRGASPNQFRAARPPRGGGECRANLAEAEPRRRWRGEGLRVWPKRLVSRPPAEGWRQRRRRIQSPLGYQPCVPVHQAHKHGVVLQRGRLLRYSSGYRQQFSDLVSVGNGIFIPFLPSMSRTCWKPFYWVRGNMGPEYPSLCILAVEYWT